MTDPSFGRVTVIGGIFMDLVIKTQRRPNLGETVVGESFGMFLGGKGLNQAIASQRMGAQTTMIGRLGNDTFGKYILDKMKTIGLETKYIVEDSQTGTGIGNPIIDASGQNSIIVVPQATDLLSPEDVDAAHEAIAQSRLLVSQLESPIAATVRAAEIARQHHRDYILNAAPIPPQWTAQHTALVQLSTILVVNEIELVQLLSIYRRQAASESFTSSPDISTETEGAITVGRAVGLAMELSTRTSVPRVIVTLGSLGLVMVAHDGVTQLAAHHVDVVDTTAAGDAFVGGLVASLACDNAWPEALGYGNGAGALAVTVVGAEPSLPTRDQVVAFITQGYVVSDEIPIAMP
eukprot:TRINITY_DN947_c0_g2_i1.p1 TRINITY_DN947_c0_g2~~TRINITY_DN947_c0_g2_i1.p1  ORF type:complete len:349 (+),score=70.46 TRINITY_DN947_c0_g2_i1:73-1119(+)